MTPRKPRILMLLAVLLLSTLTVFADAGPKPVIRIQASNLPPGTLYLDLLVPEAPPFLEEPRFREDYDPTVLQQLREDAPQGWMPVLAEGRSLTFGNLVCESEDGRCVSTFSYRVPDRFRIIALVPGQPPVISNEIQRKAFESTITFDYATGKAIEKNPLLSALAQLPITLGITLLTEGIVLLLFRFGLKPSLRPFLLINLATQLLLTAAIGFGMLWVGIVGALFFYFVAEFIIFPLEAVLFSRFLTEHSKSRRIGFALTANAVSLMAGLMAMMYANF